MSAKTYYQNNFKKGKIIQYIRTDPKKIVEVYWRGYKNYGLNPNEGLVEALGISPPKATKFKYDKLDQYVRGSGSWEEFRDNFGAIYDLYAFEGKLPYNDYMEALPEVFDDLMTFETPAMGKGQEPIEPPAPAPPPAPSPDRPRLRGSRYQVINPDPPEEIASVNTPLPTPDEPAEEVEITADGTFIPAPAPAPEPNENPDASGMPSQSTAEPTAPAPAPAPTPAPAPDPVETNMSRKTIPAVPQSVGISKIDTIPKERLITEGKTVEQLKDDLRYFKKNFKKELFRIQVDFNNNNLDYLQRKHKEIIAKLNPKQKQKTKTGIIINASDYIKEKLKEILIENSIKGLTAKDLIINVEGDDKPKDEDIGSYEFKVGANGMPMAKREPIYKYIPEVNPKAVLEPKVARIKNPPTKYRGLEQTAKKMVMNDPFIKPQKAIRFKYSY